MKLLRTLLWSFTLGLALLTVPFMNVHVAKAEDVLKISPSGTLDTKIDEWTIYLPLVTNSNLIYFDNFSNSATGWSIEENDRHKWSYIDEEYEMQIRYDGGWIGARIPIAVETTHYSVEADMRLSMDASADYGLIFDRVDWDHFYVFGVAPGDQSYAVLKYDSGWTTITGWTFSPHINPNHQTNHLKVKRMGSQYNIYINGHFLASGSDSTFSGGSRKAGLILVTTTNGTARYDNFQVKNLD